MPSILDAPVYPWPDPEAQQLHLTLSLLHPTVQATLLAAQTSGINTLMINAQQPVYFVWKEILDAATNAGLTRKLVQDVHDRLSPTSPQRPFLNALLADQPVRLDPEPRGGDGAPRFIHATDAVSEPEALLYHDDLTIQIGRVPGLITVLQRLVTLAPAVCRLVVDVAGKSTLGTGFRIGPDLLLTNWHVLHRQHDGALATAVTAEFGYEDDGQGGALGATVVPCDVATIVSSKDDDWAIVRAKQALADTWPIVKLSEAVAPTLDADTYIVQHPGGDRKRLGFVRNQITFFDNRIVHYITDTQQGSSGAPVFDAQGRLVALHHAGGRPQEVVGKPPVKKNEGIRISRVVEGLNAQGITPP
jgi:hypothetical protein